MRSKLDLLQKGFKIGFLTDMDIQRKDVLHVTTPKMLKKVEYVFFSRQKINKLKLKQS
jgi:hypothetical protein